MALATSNVADLAVVGVLSDPQSGNHRAPLGVENGVASIPSHSEPCVKVSLHTAPSLTVPLLRIQLWRCLTPFYHRDSGGVIVEDSYIHPFHLGFEV
ncbi:hypothetical protein AmaxDRAFT_4959 [Limnospira maxima CS-328]|uniref:Uncharacterized protein n=1 Tax=Limnospira maxima CS-328 TaxID=513049 RepID=B5W859_LIMMA|nr:hypothetical protein AmaxDRAFT_4959 [Limnospira maxima CS-328]UWU48757.1 hypothetical protein APLC1_3560 [Arthrospira platensis C1]